jgi:uncharacterized protein (DUF1778 family)
LKLGHLIRHAAYIRNQSLDLCQGHFMPGRAAIHRSAERSAQYLWRISPEDKELLHERAAAEGLTVQAYLERVALGRENPVMRRSGRPRTTNQRELPLTG